MSTRSAIIRKTENGQYEGVYCHFDGYLEGVGATLKAYYTDPEKVRALIALGCLSSLGREVSTDGPHSYQTPADGVTVAYARDRGDEDAGYIATGMTVAEVAEQIGHDGYVYVFNNGKWSCNGRAFGSRKAA